MSLGSLRTYRRGPRELWVSTLVLATGFFFALPGVFVFLRTASLGVDLSEIGPQIWKPLGRTVLLAASVSILASLIGTTMAWLITRSDLPGRRVWRVLVVLPLVLPSFVGAAAFLAALAPRGIISIVLGWIGLAPPAQFRGFLPSLLVLTVFTYPYVVLPVSARLLRLRPELEEGARLLGRSPLESFRLVTLPQILPSIVGGSLLVFLYTVSDFGAVQLLGYDTLTRVIYATRLSSRGVSFASAAVLILLAIGVVALERKQRSNGTPDDQTRTTTPSRVTLGKWSAPAVGLVATVVLIGLVVPVVSLTVWAIRGLAAGRVEVSVLIQPMINTALAGTVTAVLAVLVVLPVAKLMLRRNSLVARVSSVGVIGGFAVPGIVVAISLVFWAINVPGMSYLYQTFPLLIMAYVIHFGSQAMGSAEAAVRSVPSLLRDSALVLNPSKQSRFWRIEWPLMSPSLTSGAGLVLLSTIKELPATLLLAPIGFSTLSTKIWGSYEDGFYSEVGVASLLLIGLSAVLTWLLVLRHADAITSNQ